MIFQKYSCFFFAVLFSFSLSAMSKNGQLLKAVRENDKETVIQLYHNGVNMMQQDSYGQSLLLKEAIFQGSPQMVDTLLNLGVNPYRINFGTPHFYYCLWAKDICICCEVWAEINQRIKKEIKKRDKGRRFKFKAKLPREKD